MPGAELQAVATPNRSLTGTNCVYVSPDGARPRLSP